ncbi:MAG: dihydrofolate reductase family protein [Betaproteobacteria bacterium]
MRKIFVFNLVSLDGYFEGPNKDLSWHNVDGEFNEYAIDMLDSVDLLLFGRVTYELMAGYWPTSDAINNDPIVAGKMNALPKIVFSKTLEKTEWNNTRFLKGVNPKEIEKMKQGSGKDMVILGSGSIMDEFAKRGLIDEYRIMVNPIILGEGTPLFNGVKGRMNLKLTRNRAFRNGNVLLYYQPDWGGSK